MRVYAAPFYRCSLCPAIRHSGCALNAASIYFAMSDATGEDKLGTVTVFASGCPMVIIFFLRLNPFTDPLIEDTSIIEDTSGCV